MTPTWAKLIDFETTLPTAIEELMQQQKERQRARPATFLASQKRGTP